MKYIITESQEKFLIENDDSLWYKRRASTPEIMKKFIDEQITEQSTLCEDFSDEFEYADNIISDAIDEFFNTNPNVYDSPEFFDMQSDLNDKCKEWFGEELLEIFRDTCEEFNS